MAELVGMRPDLMVCKKIVYFHENQLVYPVRDVKERDCQYGLNQIMTWYCICKLSEPIWQRLYIVLNIISYSLAADIIIFNSHFNRKSFLNGINSYLNIQSDLKLRNISEQIEPKSEVLYFPIDFKQISRRESSLCSQVQVLHLLWPHRWEHDKNPQLLIDTLLELNKREVPFRVSIIGERFQTIPKCFEGIVEKLGNKLLNYGYLSRDDYFTCLRTADVVVSTAEHEFYGVSMWVWNLRTNLNYSKLCLRFTVYRLEAVYCGCVPLAPNRLVYPELYPKKYLYNTASQLVKILYNWCRNLTVFKKHRETFFESFSFEQFSTDILLPAYLKKLE